MRHLVEYGVVALVADAGEDGHGAQTDEARQFVVVEPGEVVDGAAPADDDDRIGRCRSPGPERLLDRCADEGGRVLAFEAAVNVYRVAHTVALQAISVAREVAQSGGPRRRNDKQDAEVPRRRELAIAVEDPFRLQPLPNLALPGLEVTERVRRVDRVDV